MDRLGCGREGNDQAVNGFSVLPAVEGARQHRGRTHARGALSMYWLQDIESARALARLYSESPRPPCDDAAPLIDQPAVDDIASGSNEDASASPHATPAHESYSPRPDPDQGT